MNKFTYKCDSCHKDHPCILTVLTTDLLKYPPTRCPYDGDVNGPTWIEHLEIAQPVSDIPHGARPVMYWRPTGNYVLDTTGSLVGERPKRKTEYNFYQGYFHRWSIFSSAEGSWTYAIIEGVDGRCGTVDIDNIKFLDRDPEWKEALGVGRKE